MEDKVFALKPWLKEFVFEQKCVPWRVYKTYCKMRNGIFNINTPKHWDRVWSKERYTPNSHRFYPEAFGKIISFISKGARVVDIGYGIGILLERLKREKNCDVFGVDISKEAIKTIKEKDIDGMVARVPPIPLPANSFDIVISTELLEHINTPKSLIKEMTRICKPSGYLIITTPDSALFPYLEREHVNVFNENSLKKLFNDFKEIESLEILRVKESEEKFNRFIIKAKLCPKSA